MADISGAMKKDMAEFNKKRAPGKSDVERVVMRKRCPKCGKNDDWARIPDFVNNKEWMKCSCGYEIEHYKWASLDA